MKATPKEQLSELEKCVRGKAERPAAQEHLSRNRSATQDKQTARRVEALVSETWNEAGASELTADLAMLGERLRLLRNTGDISEAAIAQEQRIITRASEMLAEHRQRLSLSRSFAFKRRSPAPVPPPATAYGLESKTGDTTTSTGSSSRKETQLEVEPAIAVPSNVLSISGLSNSLLLVGPGVAGGQEVWLRDLEACTVYVVDKIPCARLHNIRNSAVVLLQVSSAAWIHNCSKCIFAAHAQQVRVHECRDVSFFLNVASSPIIETTTGAVFAAPICSLEEGDEEGVRLTASNVWQDVKDFDWIKRQQSPNWKLLGGPKPRLYFIRCMRLNDGQEPIPPSSPDAPATIASVLARANEDMSELTSRGWRMLAAPAGLSAVGLRQHATAAEAAAAVVARSLEQSNTQGRNANEA